MNVFDLIVVVLVVIAVVIGFRSGALPQLVGLAGAILGGALALVLLPRLDHYSILTAGSHQLQYQLRQFAGGLAP